MNKKSLEHFMAWTRTAGRRVVTNHRQIHSYHINLKERRDSRERNKHHDSLKENYSHHWHVHLQQISSDETLRNLWYVPSRRERRMVMKTTVDHPIQNSIGQHHHHQLKSIPLKQTKNPELSTQKYKVLENKKIASTSEKEAIYLVDNAFGQVVSHPTVVNEQVTNTYATIKSPFSPSSTFTTDQAPKKATKHQSIKENAQHLAGLCDNMIGQTSSSHQGVFDTTSFLLSLTENSPNQMKEL